MINFSELWNRGRENLPLVTTSLVYVIFSIYLVFIKLPINWDYPAYVARIKSMNSPVFEEESMGFSIYFTIAYFVQNLFSTDAEGTYKLTLFLMLAAKYSYTGYLFTILSTPPKFHWS
jgi:hypothetical protein